MSKKIAIVGIGCRFANAPHPQAFWEHTLQGQANFAPVPEDRWNHEAFFDANPRARDRSYAPMGAWIDDIESFPALALQVPPRRAEVMDPQQRLSYEVALEAIEDSGIRPDDLPAMTGIYMGVTATEYRTLSTARIVAQLMASGKFGQLPEDASAIASAVDRVIATRPYSAPGVLSNMIAATITQQLRLRGPAFTTDAACSSSLVALDAAMKALRDGSVDCALAGGVYLCLTPEHHIAFSRIGAMSKVGRCLPFDARADGFIQGDGAAVVMLKRLEDAQRDGDRIYAVLHGIAMNNDGGENGPMAPVQEGQTDVIQRAWADAGLEPTGLGYVECHGTGTLVGDKIEFDGLRAALEDKLATAQVGLGSSKANFGHTMSAAGVTGLIRAALSLYHETIPPIANFEHPKDDLGIEGSAFFIPTEARPWQGQDRLAGVSSFGFGGTNVHVILGEGPQRPAPAPEKAELLLLSAPDESSLRRAAGDLAQSLLTDTQLDLPAVIHALGKRRRQQHRLALVVHSRQGAIDALREVSEGQYPRQGHLGQAPEAPPKIAFLYPGQGAQRVGMLHDARTRFPVVAAAFDEMDSASQQAMGRAITELIDPAHLKESPDDEKAHAAATATLTETQHAQPALFAAGYALSRLLEEVGVRPHVTAGHSVGEFTAAAAAGALSPESALAFCAARGQGMQAVTGDPGTMAAWKTDAETAEAHLAPGAIVANINHPRQVVISGPRAAVEASNAKAEAAGVEVIPLRVSHGFHSEVFADLDLQDAVAPLAFQEGHAPVISCITAAPYAGPEEARDIYLRHGRSPVRWTDTLQACRDAGAELFLQVAAGGPLVSFSRATLPELPVFSLGSREDHDGGQSLLMGLAQLFIHGVDLQAEKLTEPAPLASLPPSILPREHYWVIRDRAADPVTLRTPTGQVQAAPAAKAQAQEAPPTPASTSAPATPQATGKDPLEDTVYAAIAKASAYPLQALKADMKLGDDLGFDSMMVADLAEELRQQIPGFAGIPQELLIHGPTIQEIVDFVLSPEAFQAGETYDDDAPLLRFASAFVAHPLPARPTRDRQGQSYRLVGDLALAGALDAIGMRPTDGLADLIIFKTPEHPLSLDDALADPTAIPRAAATLIDALRPHLEADARCDLIVLRGDTFWDEAYAGAAKSIAREWPDRMVKILSGASPDAIVAELRSDDLTTEIRYHDGARYISGAMALGEAETYAPSPGERIAITGGTRGIGRRLGQRLAEAGAEVYLLGRTALQLADGSARLQAIQVDLLNREDTVKALQGLGITTLVHAAGLLADGPLGSLDAAQADRALQVKVGGLLNAISASGETLRRVLGIGSWAGRFGNRHQSHYAAANALMSAILENLPAPVVGISSEYGPWTESEMAQSIPEAIQNEMRQQGVDFVGDQAGLDALMADLGAQGIVIRGRRIPSLMLRAERTETLSLESHPFLKDHAVPGPSGDAHPVLPLASAADFIAATSGIAPPFELSQLRLYQGLVVDAPLQITAQVDGEGAQIFQGEDRKLSYKAQIRALRRLPEPPAPAVGGEKPKMTLEAFYGGITFHGPLLQGILSIDGAGSDFVRGRVRTSRPSEWVPGAAGDESHTWAIDPLAFDSAMQLAAIIAYERFQRAGTPVGVDRWIQIQAWPEAEVQVDAFFEGGDDDKLSVDLVFRDATGEVIALAEGVHAEMRKVEAQEAAAPLEIKREWIDPSAWRGYKDIAMRLQAVEAMGLKAPYFDLHEGTARNTSIIDGREVINYSSYNYIGLSGDPRIIKDVQEAIDRYGTSVSASRVASGERPFHRDLEAALAKAHGGEDALVMSGGHATNVNVLGHLFGPQDLILHDELIHDSCLQGIKLSGAARRGFKHDDARDLERQLKELRPHYEKVLILIEGVYSMDGDIADLPAYVRLKKEYGCMLMIDEAHSFGTIGRTGRGIGEVYGMDDPDSPERARYGIVRQDVDIWMGTMSKSLASMGGWVAGSKELILYLRYTTPGFVFAAGIPPALGQAALSALNMMFAEPERVQKLQENSRYFHGLLQERGIDTGVYKGLSPVIPVVTGDSMWALQLSQRLLELGEDGSGAMGINAKPIIFPAVANDAARLRLFMSNEHTREQLLYTADVIQETFAAIREEAANKRKK